MSCYVDTSVWIALLGRERTSPSVVQWFSKGVSMHTSAWTGTELASALSVKARRGDILFESVQTMCEAYENLLVNDVGLLPCEQNDFKRAQNYCQQTTLGLRAGDALHLAIALRHACSHFFSLDKTLNRNAQTLGMGVIDLDNLSEASPSR
jgi:uncharacterized protein